MSVYWAGERRSYFPCTKKSLSQVVLIFLTFRTPKDPEMSQVEPFVTNIKQQLCELRVVVLYFQRTKHHIDMCVCVDTHICVHTYIFMYTYIDIRNEAKIV